MLVYINTKNLVGWYYNKTHYFLITCKLFIVKINIIGDKKSVKVK